MPNGHLGLARAGQLGMSIKYVKYSIGILYVMYEILIGTDLCETDRSKSNIYLPKQIQTIDPKREEAYT